MNIEGLRDLDIEKYILGGLLSTKGYLSSIDYKINTKDFYNSNHRIIFNAIQETFKKSGKIDIGLLAERLKSKNKLNEIGGISYLTELLTCCISIENLGAYIEKLKEYSKKRDLYELGKYIVNNVDKSALELQSKSSELLLSTLEESETNKDTEEQGEDFIRYLEEVEQGNTKEIKTYIGGIDKIIGGLVGGNLGTIFAFSNVGKTSFALQIALNNVRMNKRVLYFSLEMSANEVRGRMISNLANMDYRHLMYEKNKTAEEFEIILEMNDKISKGLLVSNEDNLNNIVAKIQYEVLKNNLDLVIVDYIDLITLTRMKDEEYKKNIIVTRTLKRLALNLKIPIIILAQAKQEVANKMNNPNMSVYEKVSVNDIGGGASIFRDSDIVLGLYRNVELDNKEVREQKADLIDYNSKNADKNPECMQVLIKKTRASGKGIVSCKYKGDRFRIGDFYR